MDKLPNFEEFSTNEQLFGKKLETTDESHSLRVRRKERFDPGRGKGSFVAKLKYKGDLDPAKLAELIKTHPDLQTYMTGLVPGGPFFYTYETLKDTDGKEKAVFQLVKAVSNDGKKLYINYPTVVPKSELDKYKNPDPEAKKEADVIAKEVEQEIEDAKGVEINVEEIESEEPAPEESPLYTYLQPVPISKGYDFRQNVENLQNLMLALDSEALPKYGADGKFGDETMQALRDLGISDGSTFQPIDIITLQKLLKQAGIDPIKVLKMANKEDGSSEGESSEEIEAKDLSEYEELRGKIKVVG